MRKSFNNAGKRRGRGEARGEGREKANNMKQLEKKRNTDRGEGELTGTLILINSTTASIFFNKK